MNAEPAFAEIGCRSNFSFLEGASHPEELVTAAVQLGLAGFGLADRNTVAGVVRAHQAAKEAGIRFQPGARLVFADDTPDILAYPRTRKGWGHLCRLLSLGNLRADKGSCILHLADLLEWGEEMLLAVSATLVQTGPALSDLLVRLRTRFSGQVYLTLTPRHDGLDRQTFEAQSSIAQDLHVPLLASNDPFYHSVERRPMADVLASIRAHVPIAEAGFRLAANAERHLKDSREMARLLRHYPQAIANAVKFFSRLNFSLNELSHEYPDETVPGETAAQTLRRFVYEGAEQRYKGAIPAKVIRQIAYELKLIQKLEYEPYFLTVRNIVCFARSQGILCQGRGSAANSAICYCMGITEVDPAKSDLLFERFISEDRREPPDIDVDFEHERREVVIQHIYEKYGRNHAGLAAAVITYRARSAGREVAKAFGFSEDVQQALSSTIWGWSSEDLSEREAKAAGLDLSDPTVGRILGYASALMGFPRHLSQHVGGFVITRSRLDEVVPIMNTAMEGRTMVEWDKDDLDSLKILKIDVLALGMLTALRRGLDLVAQHYGERFEIATIKPDQKPVYDMICRADTIGVFQIESRAQMSMLPRLKPKNFYDLVIEVAIVRPGPIQGKMVHPYLRRRQDKEKVTYPKEELREVLEKTLGVPLFQEQAMRIAIVAAGFEPAEADKLRRAMATFRRVGTIHSFRKKMVDGMVAKGYEAEFAEHCFRQIEGFGEYGFPESHAASFALLVYASSWLKAIYPDVFCAALLNSQPMGFYAPAQLVRDAREHGVEVRPVDINHSSWDCDLEDAVFDETRIARRHGEMRGVIATTKAVRLGFRQVKGLSEADMTVLVRNRGAGYDSVRDLWLRSGLSRAVIERLADADAFGSLGLERRDAIWAAQAADGRSAAETLPLFDRGPVADDLCREEEMALPRMPLGEAVIHDYRTLKLSLKAHPVVFLRDELAGEAVLANAMLEQTAHGRIVQVAGLVLVRQRPGSAKGVVFMTIEDETGVANIIVWPKAFEQFRAVVMGARLVKVRGRLQKAEGVIHVVAEHVDDITNKLGILQRDLRDFGGLAHADEVRRPVAEQRNGRKSTGSLRTLVEDVPALATPLQEVLPKGRNFH